MIKLGVNSVLFKTVSFREAAEAIKKCGYDGVAIRTRGRSGGTIFVAGTI